MVPEWPMRTGSIRPTQNPASLGLLYTPKQVNRLINSDAGGNILLFQNSAHN